MAASHSPWSLLAAGLLAFLPSLAEWAIAPLASAAGTTDATSSGPGTTHNHDGATEATTFEWGLPGSRGNGSTGTVDCGDAADEPPSARLTALASALARLFPAVIPAQVLRALTKPATTEANTSEAALPEDPVAEAAVPPCHRPLVEAYLWQLVLLHPAVRASPVLVWTLASLSCDNSAAAAGARAAAVGRPPAWCDCTAHCYRHPRPVWAGESLVHEGTLVADDLRRPKMKSQ